ncbi:MAG: MTH1187 family thiamine-binding protein [Acidobacteria bacterium]|nr:MAG: MTH1187 family thiamine-binding protein [Acidobacteriota bacterium]
MLLAEFSISPLDKGASLSPWVSRALDLIDRSGLPYRLGPMGTTVEGEWDEVMAVVKACFERMAEDSGRISIAFKGDWRRGASGRLTTKIEKVEATLGRKLST